MTVTLIKTTKKGVVKEKKVFEAADQIAKYGIKSGQVYLAADGASHGVYVICPMKDNKLAVRPISPMGVSGPDRIMDAKQMSQVDYYLVEPPYITWTKDAMKHIDQPKRLEKKGK